MQINQDLSDVEVEPVDESAGQWTVWPDGWYRMMIDETIYKPTNAGDGMCLHVKLICLDAGPFFQKWQMEYLTLEHPKDKVREIARIKLKALATASGHPDPSRIGDSEELHGKALMVRLYSQPSGDPKYGDKDGNEQRIGDYMSCAQYEANRPQSPEGHMDAQTALHPAASQVRRQASAQPAPDDIPF